jgi:hypothetical protein
MMKSYSNKITKESFRSERGENLTPIQIKPRDKNINVKLNRTKSVQNSRLFMTNRDKTTYNLKGKIIPEKTSDHSSVKKEFKTTKEPIRIQTIKSAKNKEVKQEKIETRKNLKSANIDKKLEDAKNIKELKTLKRERQNSYKTLYDRVH